MCTMIQMSAEWLGRCLLATFSSGLVYLLAWLYIVVREDVTASCRVYTLSYWMFLSRIFHKLAFI